MRETNVSHETVALGTASIVMLDGIKDAVAVSKGSNRVEHRTLGEIIVATDGSDVTLEVLFRRAINGTLVFAIKVLEHSKPIGRSNRVFTTHKEGIS